MSAKIGGDFLVAITNGGLDRELIELAGSHAAIKGVNLVALHVIEVGWDRRIDGYDPDLQQAGLAVLKRAGQFHDPGNGVKFIPHCQQSRSAGRAIVEYARDRNIGAIFVGSHRFLGEEGLEIGTTTQHVLKHAPCPVVTWHQNP